jgi:hypothetical protein
MLKLIKVATNHLDFHEDRFALHDSDLGICNELGFQEKSFA